jgi:xanthine dehydrogenase YagR molybdenum-binding subunit
VAPAPARPSSKPWPIQAGLNWDRIHLADYVMAVNADVPKIEVHFLDFPDQEINELGARGIGEIGLAGFAAAMTAAVHHATGVRVRELPIKIEDLLS